MKNLRKVESYDIGLDNGDASDGWAVVDRLGELCSFKGKPTWGSRLFPSAEPAAVARVHRGQRRRYDRRRQRLNLLQQLFAKEMFAVDPDFFIRLNQASLLEEDRDENCRNYRWPLFNGEDYTETEYYKQFPTIYHLRSWLTEYEDKADIRLIYLACHNIVKARGNFLYQENDISAKNANMSESVISFCVGLMQWQEKLHADNAFDGEMEGLDALAIETVLTDGSLSRGEKQKKLEPLFGFPKEQKKTATTISKLLVGYTAELTDIFGGDPEESKFSFSDDEKVEAYYDKCPDEGFNLYAAMLAVHSAFMLMGILKAASGKTISFCKVAEYEKYKSDLKTLKELVQKYRPECYDEMFRGPIDNVTNSYSPSQAKGYTRYNLARDKKSQDSFYKEVQALFKDTEANSDPRFIQMVEDIKEGTFLKRLKTSDNGVIPYQLHLEELHAIIEKQSKYYPFLADDYKGLNKIESLVSFRIPYYVGPLTQKNAAKNKDGKNRFAWSERFEGKENEKIFPWNWNEIIDRDKSAENFMNRMIGTCTYLQGEQVMARCSLMYEMFCVLNELAGARWSNDGDKSYRLDVSDRLGIVEDLFKKRKTVSYKAVENWLCNHGHFGHIKVSGGQGVTGFESKLNSYNDFCKILSVEELSAADEPMVEDLILWNTLFEDRDILKRRIKQKYGERLSSDEVTAICKKRYTGWGRLSKKLLTGIKLPTSNGERTILELLAEGDQNSDRRIGQAMTFMEILKDERLGLEFRIEEHNQKLASKLSTWSIEDLPGSPALRRSINQGLRIVDEIVSIAGKPPANIFIEVARDDERPYKKLQRTRRRFTTVKNAVEQFKEDDPELWAELLRAGEDPAAFSSRLELYFRQRGKSMYSGKPLDIRKLSSYQIDHIIPQAYIKDDSIENKVLVLPGENQDKTDNLLIDPTIRKKMQSFWKSLHDANLIGDKKLRNLLRTEIRNEQLKGFIARQLVETSQIIKAIQGILAAKYPSTNVLPVKAALTSELREVCNLPKCREINDFHHAHDAYLACQMGRFIQYRHADFYDNPIRVASVMREFIRKEGEAYKLRKRSLGSAGFFVQSFLRSGFDKETGEVFKDAWDAEKEIARIRKSLNFKDCFITRMPEETSGAFWKATLYSPHDPKVQKYDLPPKGNLDPKKYGTYQTESFAYFFIYTAFNKKGAKIVEFAPLPVRIASMVSQNSDKLEEYARQLSEEKQLTFSKIEKRKILKYQVVEIDACRLFITGRKELRNATQFAFSLKETELFDRMSKEQYVEEDELNHLFSVIREKYARHAKRLDDLLDMDHISELFNSSNAEAKKSAILSLVSIAGAHTNMIDLSCIGGLKCAGCQQISFGSVLTKRSDDFSFIDQSVTGMYERKYKLEL